jgi:uncharacterized repeat protein (TIGR03803 family)
MRRAEGQKMACSAWLFPMIVALGAVPAQASDFRTIHVFPPAGDIATGSLIYDGAETLFGTADSSQEQSFGSIFKLSLSSGQVATEYAFTNGADGANPSGAVSLMNGKIYGASRNLANGISVNDLLFAIDVKSGAVSDLYKFGDGMQDGGFASNIVAMKNAVYGTALVGGAYGLGMVYKFDVATGTQTVLHAFSGALDGAYPGAVVLARGNTIFGTTSAGGSGCNCGTIFAVNAHTGAETILWRFPSGSGSGAGSNVVGGLTIEHGVLYGTTYGVGDVVGVSDAAANANVYGSVFKLDLQTKVFTTLYQFTGKTDGANPAGPLVSRGGILYGTTSGGGDPATSCGVVFALDTATSVETVLHTFMPATDGCAPFGLTFAQGAYYGTTSALASGFAYGSLFRFRR